MCIFYTITDCKYVKIYCTYIKFSHNMIDSNVLFNGYDDEIKFYKKLHF